MAITLLALQAAVDALNADITVTESVGSQEGDYHFVFIAHRSSVGYVAPSGWTKLIDESSGNNSTGTTTSIASGEVFYIRRGASAPDLTFVKEPGNGDIARARMVTLRGANQTNPIASFTSRTHPTNVSGPQTIDPSVGSAGDYLLGFLGAADNLTISAPHINSDPQIDMTILQTGGTNTGADMASAIAGIELTQAINNTIQFTVAGTRQHMIGAIVVAAPPSHTLTGAGSDQGATSAAGGITQTAPPPNRTLRIDATNTLSRVRSTAAYNGALDLTFDLTVTQRSAAVVDDWHTLVFYFSNNIDLNVGPSIIFAPTYLHAKLADASEDFNGSYPTAVGTKYKCRVLQSGSSLSVFINDASAFVLSHVVDDTDVYFGFSMEQGIVEIDNISGTITQDFETVTASTYPDGASIGTSLTKHGGGTVSVVQYGDNGLPKIGYYGDSTVYGVNGGVDGGQVAVPAPVRVAELLGYTVYNEGVSGTNTTQLINGTDGVHPVWTTEMANSDATHVIVNHAINDYANDQTTYKANLTTLVNGIRNEGKVAILETPNPTYQLLWGGTTDSDVEVANRAQWMREVAATMDVPVIDQFQMINNYFITSNTTAADFTPDGGHPTQSGYTLKGDFAAQQIQSVVDGERITSGAITTGSATSGVGAVTVDAPAVSHNLSGSSTTQPSSSSVGEVAHQHNTTGTASSQANVSSTGTVSRALSLTGAGTLQSSTSSTGNVDGSITLSGASADQASTSGTAAIGRVIDLEGSETTQANETSSGALGGMSINLTGSGASQAASSGTGGVTKEYNLTSTPTAQASTSSSGVVSQVHDLIGQACDQAAQSIAAAMGAVADLVGAATDQANACTQGAVEQVRALLALSSNQTNESLSGPVEISHTLLGVVSTQSNSSQAAGLVGEHDLSASPCFQNNESGTGIILFFNGEPDPNTTLRIPAEYRVLHALAEDRVLIVERESRTLQVQAENRTLKVELEDRTLVI